LVDLPHGIVRSRPAYTRNGIVLVHVVTARVSRVTGQVRMLVTSVRHSGVTRRAVGRLGVWRRLVRTRVEEVGREARGDCRRHSSDWTDRPDQWVHERVGDGDRVDAGLGCRDQE
jgi:hypothetical protein